MLNQPALELAVQACQWAVVPLESTAAGVAVTEIYGDYIRAVHWICSKTTALLSAAKQLLYCYMSVRTGWEQLVTVVVIRATQSCQWENHWVLVLVCGSHLVG